MNHNIDIPHIKTNHFSRESRLNSNNDIFERDVQGEYKYNSPKSPGVYSAKIESELDPMASSTNPFLINSPKEPFHKGIEKPDGSPVFNKSFSFDGRTHSDNQLSKVPTHVLSVDDYINSDMDEKCCSNNGHTHCNNKLCADCKKYNAQGNDSSSNKEYCDDYAERMEYFNHKQSSFDRYISESVAKLARKKKSLSNDQTTNVFRSPNLKGFVDEKEPDSDDNDINMLTAEVVRSSLSEPQAEDDDEYLSNEEFEDRRLSRERSKSLTSIIVKGLSKSCK